MPSIRDSQNVPMNALAPAVQGNRNSDNQSTGKTDDTSNLSPFMLSSMPLIAATADLFTRQFYGGTKVPQQRILPPRKR